MAKCRILNLKPPCSYTLEGLASIVLLDFEDFGGFKFDGDNLYDNCRVVAIFKTGDFVDTHTPDTAKYASTVSGKIYTHILDTFVPELSAELSAALDLGLRRRYVPVFQAKNGRYYTFGYEAGAALTYANQTNDGIGAVITLTAASIYPLFEVTGAALTTAYGIEFKPDFENGAYCEII